MQLVEADLKRNAHEESVCRRCLKLDKMYKEQENGGNTNSPHDELIILIMMMVIMIVFVAAEFLAIRIASQVQTLQAALGARRVSGTDEGKIWTTWNLGTQAF